MNTQTKEDINAAIKQGLPEMVGNILQARLAECDSLEAQLKDANEQIKNQRKTIDSDKIKLIEFGSKESRFINNENLEKQLDKELAELKLRERMLDYKESLNHEKVELMKEMFKIPFQNRILREKCLTNKAEHFSSVDTYNNNAVTESTAHMPYNDTKDTEEA